MTLLPARLRRRFRTEAGVTLVEALIAIGILTAALTMVGMPLSAALNKDEDFRAELGATTTLRRASGWVSRDAFTAETISVLDSSAPVDTMTVDWLDTGGVPHNASYNVWGSDLVRTIDGAPFVVARGVNTVAFSRAADLLTFALDVQAASGSTDNVTSYFLLRSLQ